MKVTDEFIYKTDSPRDFHFKLGSSVASSLSGFIAGVVFASILWGLGIFVFNLLTNIIPK
ncbi:MAG: hypothetical protein WCW78_02705 [Candidatus Paceibacterota bacterium]